MARGVRQWAGLSPACHAPVNEAWVAGEENVGAEAKPLHRARAEPFDQAIGVRREINGKRNTVRMLQIDGHGRPRARQQFEACRDSDPEVACGNAIHANDTCAEIGKQHRRHRPGADTGEFNNAKACEWSHFSILSASRREPFRIFIGVWAAVLAKDHAKEEWCLTYCQLEKHISF